MIDPAGLAPIFRDEWSQLLATLVRDLGDLDIAEDAAQDAFLEASSRWSNTGTPDRPGAWLLTVARRKAIDRIRTGTRSAERLIQLQAITEQQVESSPTAILDDQLALLLGCCHPALSLDAQVALTLRVVAGLSSGQIARAFLVSEQTMVRRITRAKTKIRGAGIPFSVPDRGVLDERIGSVCQVIYLIFNEGHSSASVSSVVRGDLCDEAIWLSDLLSRLVPKDPEVLGLAALILLTDSRRGTRLDDKGFLILLEDQNRSLWDQVKISQGLDYLGRAHALGHLGPFQIQASIQALHAAAPRFDDTNWASIVRLYDLLLLRQPSAVIALNRAAALSYIEGPEAALSTLAGLESALDGYVHFHSTRAELLLRSDRSVEAIEAFAKAIQRSSNETERRHLEGRRSKAGPLRS